MPKLLSNRFQQHYLMKISNENFVENSKAQISELS